MERGVSCRAAELDALFDSGLITFSEAGGLVISPTIAADQRELLGLNTGPTQKLRWISPNHLLYLSWHREHVFKS